MQSNRDNTSAPSSKKRTKEQATDNNKKYKQDEEEANNNLMPKKKLHELKTIANPSIQNYFNGISNFESFKSDMNALKALPEKGAEVLLAYKEVLHKEHSNHAQKEERTNLVHAWFLDELENNILNLETYYEEYKRNRDAVDKLIIELFHSDKLIDLALSKPNLKKFIEAHCLVIVVLYLSNNKNVFTFIDKHYPDTGLKRLADFRHTVGTGSGKYNQRFLDILLEHNLYSYIVPFWDKGCRPESQEEFNDQLFLVSYNYSKMGSENTHKLVSFDELEAVYSQIVEQAQYHALLPVYKANKSALGFIINPALTTKHYQLIRSKLKLPQLTANGLTHVTRELYLVIYFYSRQRAKVSIDKLLFLMNEIDSQNIPASALFLNIDWNTKTALIKDKFIQFTTRPQYQNSAPASTFHNEVLFNLLLPIFTFSGVITDPNKDGTILIIKTILDYLKSKKIASKQILLVLLLVLFNSGHFSSGIKQELAKLEPIFSEYFNDIPAEEFAKIISEFLSISLQCISDLYNKVQSNLNNVNNFSIKLRTEYYIKVLYGLLQSIPKEVRKSLLEQNELMFYHNLALIIRMHIVVRTIFCLNYELQISTIMKELGTEALSVEPNFEMTPKLMSCIARGDKLFNPMVMFHLVVVFINSNPRWLFYSTQNQNTNNENECDILSYFFKCLFNPNDIKAAIEGITAILNVITSVEGALLPQPFLSLLATTFINPKEKARLGKNVQVFVENTYNKCIHIAQETKQEEAFEKIRTDLLVKYDIDPTKDKQAIHDVENHRYADMKYQNWLLLLGETGPERSVKLNAGYNQIKTYLDDIKQKKLNEQLALISNKAEDLETCFRYMLGLLPASNNLQAITIKNQFITANKITNFLSNLNARSNSIPTNIEQTRAKNDATKLKAVIGMIGYMSQHECQFGVFSDKAEARNILYLELVDQVENPSCDQGPYMRFLMAMEPVCPEMCFPKFTRTNIQFHINRFINEHYNQLTLASKPAFIKSIYEKIDDDEKSEAMEIIPPNSFASLIKPFMETYKEYLTLFTESEIATLFNLDRPISMHAQITTDVNKYIKLQNNSVHRNATDTMFADVGSNGNNNNDNNNNDYSMKG